MYRGQVILHRGSAVLDIVIFDVEVKVLWGIGQADAKEGVRDWSESVDVSCVERELGWTLIQRQPPGAFVQLSPKVKHIYYGPTIRYEPILIILRRFQNLDLKDHVGRRVSRNALEDVRLL